MVTMSPYYFCMTIETAENIDAVYKENTYDCELKSSEKTNSFSIPRISLCYRVRNKLFLSVPKGNFVFIGQDRNTSKRRTKPGSCKVHSPESNKQ